MNLLPGNAIKSNYFFQKCQDFFRILSAKFNPLRKDLKLIRQLLGRNIGIREVETCITRSAAGFDIRVRSTPNAIDDDSRTEKIRP
jgi:hypothetical protein